MARLLSILSLVFLFSAAVPGSSSAASTAAPAPTPMQQLFLLKEVMPEVQRVGLIWSKSSSNHEALMPSIQRAAAASGVEVFVAYADAVADVAAGYRSLRQEHDVQVLWVLEETGAMDSNMARSFLIKESLKRSLPLLAPTEAWVNDGAALHLQERNGQVHLVANKSACDAMALAIPTKYSAQTSYLTMN